MKTIVALATPPFKSALAIIRVSGDDAFSIVSKISSKKIDSIKERTLLYSKIINGEEIIDEVVLAIYKGPKSFTGEDLVEIMIHGSVLIANQIIELLLANGASLATNGEYSQRAFLNGKIDLLQAEAINDVINSISKESKNLSMLSLEGKTSDLIKPIKTKLADLMALIEVNIDFPEYQDIEVANKEKIITSIEEIDESVGYLIEDGSKARLVKEGINVAIIGKPNVGKSSLLNALLGADKAIVTPEAGTTRDIVEGDINLGGLTLHLFDTAGIHDSSNKIENIGINKAVSLLKDTDLILVVLDGSQELDAEDIKILDLVKNYRHLLIFNKKDIKHNSNQGIHISAINKDINELKEAIFETFGIEENVFKTPSLNNSRQLGLLKRCLESLKKAKEDAENNLPVDLIVVSISDAYHAVLEILGEDNTSDFTKEIFSRFCVGK